MRLEGDSRTEKNMGGKLVPHAPDWIQDSILLLDLQMPIDLPMPLVEVTHPKQIRTG